MTFESNKLLGGIGALLIFVGVFPFVNFYGIVDLIGAVLILVALHGFSTIYKEQAIFTNAIYGIIVGIVGAIIAVVAVVFTVLTSITDLVHQIYPGWNGDWSTLQGMTPNTTNIDPNAVFPIIGGIIAVLVIVWIFAIIAAFFIWRSLKHVSNKSGIGLFGTAGLLLLVGAVIPLIGLLLMWIAALLLAIAFFTMKPHEQQMPTMASPPPPPPT